MNIGLPGVLIYSTHYYGSPPIHGARRPANQDPFWSEDLIYIVYKQPAWLDLVLLTVEQHNNS